MVLAKKRDKREAAADILGTHGAESIEFYGRWSWHSLEPHPAAPDGSLRDPAPGRTYEIRSRRNDNTCAVGLRVQGDDPAQVRGFSRSLPHTGHASQTTTADDHLAGADRTTNVHVYDFESGEVHAVVSYFNRSVLPRKGHRAPSGLSRAVTPRSARRLVTTFSPPARIDFIL